VKSKVFLLMTLALLLVMANSSWRQAHTALWGCTACWPDHAHGVDVHRSIGPGKQPFDRRGGCTTALGRAARRRDARHLSRRDRATLAIVLRYLGRRGIPLSEDSMRDFIPVLMRGGVTGRHTPVVSPLRRAGGRAARGCPPSPRPVKRRVRPGRGLGLSRS
jgi:hypothetical protein